MISNHRHETQLTSYVTQQHTLAQGCHKEKLPGSHRPLGHRSAAVGQPSNKIEVLEVAREKHLARANCSFTTFRPCSEPRRKTACPTPACTDLILGTGRGGSHKSIVSAPAPGTLSSLMGFPPRNFGHREHGHRFGTNSLPQDGNRQVGPTLRLPVIFVSCITIRPLSLLDFGRRQVCEVICFWISSLLPFFSPYPFPFYPFTV